jgi:K+-sensing histidine kinase KdpD
VSLGECTLFERESREQIYESFLSLSSQSLLPQILDAIPNVCVVVNQGNQIVFANKTLMELMGTTERFSTCGLRPGEALHCTHAGVTPDGCGTTESCETCGAANAIKGGQGGSDVAQECRITRADGRVLDLRVWTTPVTVEGKPYTVMTLEDVSNEKRRRVLERVFFHDIMNTAGALRGFCELLFQGPPKDPDRLKNRIFLLSSRLIEEIRAQKELTDAENGELSVSLCQITSTDLLGQVADQFLESTDLSATNVTIDQMSERVVFVSDPTLLRRVLGNLIKNGVEASRRGEAVTIGSYRLPESVEFRIHNNGSMPRKVQLQVFQRSFSTKGTGRGLGTYGAKLLTEQYLNGRIGFTTSRDSGTTFVVSYPLKTPVVTHA